MPSIERRLARFIADERNEVQATWKQFMAHVLPFWRDKKRSFVLDLTPFNDEATIVYLGLLVHSRLLPVAWWTMPAQTKWQEGQWSIVERLLDAIIPYLGQAECTDDSQIGDWWERPWSRSARDEAGIISYEYERRIRVAARWVGPFVEDGLALIPFSANREIVGRDVPLCGRKSQLRRM